MSHSSLATKVSISPRENSDAEAREESEHDRGPVGFWDAELKGTRRDAAKKWTFTS